MFGSDHLNPNPIVGFLQVCFIKDKLQNPAIIVDDYTYYDDPEGVANFVQLHVVSALL